MDHLRKINSFDAMHMQLFPFLRGAKGLFLKNGRKTRNEGEIIKLILTWCQAALSE